MCLLLWSPTDTRLFWLLGELYAAHGQFAEAKKIMNISVSEARQYGNRKILMEHRTAVRTAADAQEKLRADAEVLPSTDPTANEDANQPQTEKAVPFDLGAVWIYFGVVAVVVGLAVFRAIMRKPRGVRGLSR